jgi:hypothetical protein
VNRMRNTSLSTASPRRSDLESAISKLRSDALAARQESDYARAQMAELEKSLQERIASATRKAELRAVRELKEQSSGTAPSTVPDDIMAQVHELKSQNAALYEENSLLKSSQTRSPAPEMEVEPAARIVAIFADASQLGLTFVKTPSGHVQVDSVIVGTQAASTPGIVKGLVLERVCGTDVQQLDYNIVIAMLRASTRPMELVFQPVAAEETISQLRAANAQLEAEAKERLQQLSEQQAELDHWKQARDSADAALATAREELHQMREVVELYQGTEELDELIGSSPAPAMASPSPLLPPAEGIPPVRSSSVTVLEAQLERSVASQRMREEAALLTARDHVAASQREAEHHWRKAVDSQAQADMHREAKLEMETALRAESERRELAQTELLRAQQAAAEEIAEAQKAAAVAQAEAEVRGGPETAPRYRIVVAVGSTADSGSLLGYLHCVCGGWLTSCACHAGESAQQQSGGAGCDAGGDTDAHRVLRQAGIGGAQSTAG